METIVKISEYKIGNHPVILSTRALGSCVAVCLFDTQKNLGGLCHFILPDSSISREKNYNPAKFADTGIRSLLDDMLKKNGRKSAMIAKLVGGARMFAALGDSLNIGEKNVRAAEKVLGELKIPIIATDTGEDFGRNVKMFLDSGKVEVSSFRKGVSEL